MIRLLREVGLGARRAIVVLLGSSVDSPADLERETAALDLPLPTREELSALLQLIPPEERRGWDFGASRAPRRASRCPRRRERSRWRAPSGTWAMR